MGKNNKRMRNDNIEENKRKMSFAAPQESVRELRKAYETFLADDRVLPMLPPILGKTFFEVRKQVPTWIHSLYLSIQGGERVLLATVSNCLEQCSSLDC